MIVAFKQRIVAKLQRTAGGVKGYGRFDKR